MKKIVALFIASLLLFALSMSALADYTPGVTTVADPDSPTGFTTTIVYEAPGAETVTLSGSFAFHEYGHPLGAEYSDYYTPEEWKDGLFAHGQESHKMEMEKVEGTDYFVKTLQLPSGHYQYCFYVDGAETRVDDPTNPGQYALIENGGKYTRSVFDVPYDAEKQPKSQDYAYAAKRTDGKVGTLEYVPYTDVNGNPASLGVYTPYGYDAKREEPYKVLYLSHGKGGDETFWFGGGAAAEVFDNLIADGKMEPTFIITMNNEVYDWNWDVVLPNIKDCIVPFVEANYNVCTESSGKAFAGLSMGGMTTTQVYYNYTEDFDYYGMFSAFVSDLDWAAKDLAVLQKPSIMMGAGYYDFLLAGSTKAVVEGSVAMRTLGVDHYYYEVPGAHEWFTWIQLLRIFGETVLWK